VSAADSRRVALVTGGAGNLGLAIVGALAASGCKVLLTDIDGDAAERAARQFDDDVQAIALDVTSKRDFESALEACCAKWGGAGILVNNAALTKTTPIFDISADEFDAVVAIALKGTFLGCQVFGRYFAERGFGRIVNVASLAAQNGGSATGAHYAAAKGGVLTLTKVFARDLAAAGVTVNAVSPGPLNLDSVRALLPPEKIAAVIHSIPVGCLGEPSFVAHMIALLTSPDAVSATGATFDLNGGLYMR
jgi:3-oxoacyl-[acyl-carrier protein] reductase